MYIRLRVLILSVRVLKIYWKFFFFYIYFFIALLILTLVIRSVTLRRAVSYEHEQRGRLLAYPAPCLEVFTAVPDVDYV